MTSTEVLLAARCKKVYANAHTYHINSISVNSDQETFLSADDLRVNLWNLVGGGAGGRQGVSMYEGSVGHDVVAIGPAGGDRAEL